MNSVLEREISIVVNEREGIDDLKQMSVLENRTLGVDSEKRIRRQDRPVSENLCVKL